MAFAALSANLTARNSNLNCKNLKRLSNYGKCAEWSLVELLTAMSSTGSVMFSCVTVHGLDVLYR